ncbi:MAG: SMI1/KNR4 family protein [Campylobacteraceae bacterium]
MSNKIEQIATSLIKELPKKSGVKFSDIERTEKRLSVALPQSLKDFYLSVGNTDIFTSSFEEFGKLDELFIKEGKLIFLCENQGVCFWGVDLNDEQVYMCTDLEAKKIDWESEETKLEEFLQIIMYYQVAQGGYEFGAALYESEFENNKEYLKTLKEITKDFTKVVNHNGLVIYKKEHKLVWHFLKEDKKTVENILFASTLTKKDLEEFEDRFGFEEL